MEIEISNADSKNELKLCDDIEKLAKDNGLVLLSSGFGSWCGVCYHFTNEKEIIEKEVTDCKNELKDLKNQKNKLNRKISALHKVSMKGK